ncbi:hypothetical protein DAI22_01g379650 [Oryza sativa Japonica Group]|nr:hypothetical protein DAI22_01g379650 [Oryza sativa Japonica Group]
MYSTRFDAPACAQKQAGPGAETERGLSPSSLPPPTSRVRCEEKVEHTPHLTSSPDPPRLLPLSPLTSLLFSAAPIRPLAIRPDRRE